MEMDLASLPISVRLMIYRMCGQLDLESLVLCSKWMYNEVTPILWKDAKISWHTLEENTTLLRTNQHTSNLLYISLLEFYGDGNGELDIEEQQRGYLSFGFGYFLQFCNPEQMQSLSVIDFMPANGLRLICETFRNLHHLNICCVSANWDYLTHIPPSLKYLSLQRCDIRKEHLDVICTMENLEDLVISECQHLSDEDFSAVNNIKLKNLLQMDLMRTLANDAFIATCSKVCEKLIDLKLNRTSVSDLGVACVAHIPTIEKLFMACMQQITDIGVYYISKLPALQHLILTFCDGLSPDSLKYIGTMTNLRILLISGSFKEATDEDFAAIGNLTSLCALDIPHMNNLTNASLEVISTLKDLDHLDINCEGFSDDGLVHLTKLQRLRVLRMPTNSSITEEGLELHGLKDVIVRPTW